MRRSWGDRGLIRWSCSSSCSCNSTTAGRMSACCNKPRSMSRLRYFLDWSLTTTPPDASLLTVFRQRLGPPRWQAILQETRAAGAGSRVSQRSLALERRHARHRQYCRPSDHATRGTNARQLLAAAEPFAAAEVAAHRAGGGRVARRHERPAQRRALAAPCRALAHARDVGRGLGRNASTSVRRPSR